MSTKNPAAVALGSIKSPAKAAAARANGRRGGRPSVALYGFSAANRGDEAAWFYTRAAAERFSAACGWDGAVVEESDTSLVARRDIMDTAKKPWNK